MKNASTFLASNHTETKATTDYMRPLLITGAVSMSLLFVCTTVAAEGEGRDGDLRAATQNPITQCFGQTQRHFRADSASALEYPIECRGGHIELCCKLPASDAVGLQVDFADESAGMRSVVHRHQW